jgi:hypothetical protein
MRNKNHETDMLYRLLALTEKSHSQVMNQLPQDIQDWWKKRKLLEADHDMHERIKLRTIARALRKLTPKERTALGLNSG